MNKIKKEVSTFIADIVVYGTRRTLTEERGCLYVVGNLYIVFSELCVRMQNNTDVEIQSKETKLTENILPTIRM